MIFMSKKPLWTLIEKSCYFVNCIGSYFELRVLKTSKTGLQRPAARYDGIGKIGGGYGFLLSMVSSGGSQVSLFTQLGSLVT